MVSRVRKVGSDFLHNFFETWAGVRVRVRVSVRVKVRKLGFYGFTPLVPILIKWLDFFDELLPTVRDDRFVRCRQVPQMIPLHTG
jgi:hypothetical protein